jgi:hypothetical protein
MTNQNAIDNNIFGLFANNEDYSKATIAIKEAADNLIAVMKQYDDAGATDTEGVDAIAYYVADNL